MEYTNKPFKNKILCFLVFGTVYITLEVISRALCNSLVGFNGISALSLCGWTSIWMFPISGLCGVIISIFNEQPQYNRLKMWQQTLIGGSLITIIELSSGIIFNIFLKLNLWDYSHEKFNFIGQICLQNCIVWFLLSVVIVWLDDILSYYIYADKKPNGLLIYYKKLLKLQ